MKITTLQEWRLTKARESKSEPPDDSWDYSSFFKVLAILWSFLIGCLIWQYVFQVHRANDLLAKSNMMFRSNFLNEEDSYVTIYHCAMNRQQHIIRAANLLRHWHRTEALKELNTAP